MTAMTSLILVLVTALISGTQGSRMSELDCGEGMMRGLDGACVKKFVLPKTKLECPKLSVDNGEIFLIGEIYRKDKTQNIFRPPCGARGIKQEQPNKEK